MGVGTLAAHGIRMGDCEVQKAQRMFTKWDRDDSGTISTVEVQDILEKELGRRLPEEDLFVMLAEIDKDHSGEIDFVEFLQLFHQYHVAVDPSEDTAVVLDAFVALGGGRDLSGEISCADLKKVLSVFELNIDLEAFLQKYDSDWNGKLNWKEFKAMMDQTIQNSKVGFAG